MAVKTRFLMAEALFEMAKQNRKLNQADKADDHIGQGKRILEEAMRDYPNTTLAAQGEFLLANLAEELTNYQEAIGRYSHVIRTWPETEYASRSQYKKALCLEKMNNYDQACEEYVRLTYVYPESPLVADAIIRLATYYYGQEKFATAGKIFHNFQQRNPSHDMAPKALFLAAQCHIKQKDYEQATTLLEKLVAEYDQQRELRAEGMYWLGDSYFQMKLYPKAYQTFKKLTWDYPESKWAKYARGRLTDEALVRAAEGEE
jgi:TolA-binding protein